MKKNIKEKGNEQKETKEYSVRMCVDQSKKWESTVMILGKNEREKVNDDDEKRIWCDNHAMKKNRTIQGHYKHMRQLQFYLSFSILCLSLFFSLLTTLSVYHHHQVNEG